MQQIFDLLYLLIVVTNLLASRFLFFFFSFKHTQEQPQETAFKCNQSRREENFCCWNAREHRVGMYQIDKFSDKVHCWLKKW